MRRQRSNTGIATRPAARIADDLLRQFAECDAGMGRVRADGHMAQVLVGIGTVCTAAGFDRILRLAITRAGTSPVLEDAQRAWVQRRLSAHLSRRPQAQPRQFASGLAAMLPGD